LKRIFFRKEKVIPKLDMLSSELKMKSILLHEKDLIRNFTCL
jgi:hypothetical protein